MMNVACWNVRSLVENEGTVETARVRKDERAVKGSVDRKVVLLVWELRRYNIYAAGISETKWFSSNVYEVEGHVVLHSGRELPKEGESFQRSEGVGIVLSPKAAKAWRDGGEQWEPVSSRVVTARLRLDRVGSQHRFLHLVSVYAPTFRAPQQVKDDFFADVQMVIDKVPEKDFLMIVGDWNARVGSQLNDDQWEGVLGKHGFGRVNVAGLFLLSFCSANNLSIMNSFFEKKNIHKQTWQHPGTKAWHCIDFVIMRQNQRKCCVDTQVMRGAECWSDHRLVRAKLRVNNSCRRRMPQNGQKRGAKRLNMNQLKSDDVRNSLTSKLSVLLNQRWSSHLSVQDKLQSLVDNVKEAANQVLTGVTRKTADWFLENEHEIQPALEKRSRLLRAWLSSGLESDKAKYVKQKGAVQRLIRHVKNKWFQAKAKEIEYKIDRSRSAWKSIKQLQQAKSGLRPVAPRALKKEDGSPCKSADECNKR